MKLLLIWPKSHNEVLGYGDLGAVAEPLALEYLAAGARAEGHDVRLLDLRLHPQDLDSTVEEFRPDAIGVTAFSMHVLPALAVCRRVRELAPACKTIVGGHHATLLPEDFFEDEVDIVVVGEGVGPLRRILRALEEGDGVEGLPGVWSRVEGEFVSGGPPAEFDVDSLPVPDREITAADRSEYFIDWMRLVALVRTSVGCPFRCTFCSLWKIMDGIYFMRDIDQVVAELKQVKEEFVFLVDDEAFINGKRMAALAAALKAAGVHKRFFTYCRIDSLLRLKDNVLPAWREVGLERLFVGVDATSERELVEYKKKVGVSEIEEGLAAAKALGIEIFAQFVVNPNFTRQDFRRLIRFIEHHKISYPSFTVLTPIPGTELLSTFDHVVQKQSNGRPDWNLFDCQHAVTETTLPEKEFYKEYKNLYRVFGGNVDMTGRSYAQYRGFLGETQRGDGDAKRPRQVQMP